MLADASQSRAVAVVSALLLALSAARAQAHPKIDAARARIEAAEFDAALRLLAEAEAGIDLSREDALTLLELRALVHLALRESDAAAEALRMLAALEPRRAFAPGTSPDLVHAFARVRAQAPPSPRVALEFTVGPDGVHVRARVEGDPLRLTRGVRLFTRVGDGPERSALADETIASAAPGQRVEMRAIAEGLGGAPIAASETASVVVPEARAASAPSPWLYAGIAASALALAGTALAIALASGSAERTQPLAPKVVTP